MTISGLVGGSIWLRFTGGTPANSATLGNGVNTFLLRSNGNTSLLIEQASGAITAGTIDNISVKELPGNHAVQATTANRPIYGIHPFGGRRNLLVRTEEFDVATWVKAAVSVAADTITVSSSGTFRYMRQSTTLTSATAYTFAVDLKYTGSAQWIWLIGETNANAFGYFDIQNGVLGGAGGMTTSITALSDGWYRCRITFTKSSATAVEEVGIGFADADGSSNAIIGQTVRVRNPQLETGSTATAYQRVTDQYNVTEAGVSSVSYLFFDGVNDSLATPSINFATATSDGQARRNLLTFPSAFDDVAWVNNGGTVSANALVAPDGTSTADYLVRSSAAGDGRYQVVAAGTSGVCTASVYIKKDTSNNSLLWLYDATAVADRVFATVAWSGSTPVVTATVGTAATPQDVGNGWWRLSVSSTVLTGANTNRLYLLPAYTGSSNGQQTAFWGAQLETGTTASAFQNIGTDKMTVFAGVRKLSDAAQTTIVGSDVTSSGIFELNAPGGGTVAESYSFRSRGTATVFAGTGGTFLAPTTNVLSATGNISGDLATLRVNGTQAAQSTGDQGTGTYGNYPLFVGSRGGTSLFFSGHLYSLIVRGAQSNTGQISSTETWVAGKTGVVI
jgi:hypothetical protein